MRLEINHCIIHDVLPDPIGGGRIVILQMDEEDLFKMLDKVNPKNIIKYLDMRKIPHRDKIITKIADVDKKRLKNLYKNLQSQRNKIHKLEEKSLN